VQLEELAAVILVGRTAARGAVVEIDQHGGTGRDRLQHLAEIAQSVAADDVAVIGRQRHGNELVARGIDVEMVVPEVGQHLAQLPAAAYGARQRGGGDGGAQEAALLAGHGRSGGLPMLLDRLVDDGERALVVDLGFGGLARVLELDPARGDQRRAVVFLRRPKLLGEPAFRTLGAEGLEITIARPEGELVERGARIDLQGHAAYTRPSLAALRLTAG
jgi:hypothetical protein